MKNSTNKYLRQTLSMDKAMKGYDMFVTIKEYIQPFEKVLADMELRGLQGEEPEKVFSNLSKANRSQIIRKKELAPILLERLAYWERINNGDLIPTTQVMIEKTQNKVKNGDLHRNRRLRYGLHDIHEYRGKFFPQLVKALINSVNLQKESIVLDPMCGSGTALLEAKSMGMKTIGLDMNPLSVMISEVKTELLDVNPKTILRFKEKILKEIDNNDSKIKMELSLPPEDITYLLRWFNQESLNEIGQLIKIIDKSSEGIINQFFKICLSNILREVSWQKETDLRVRKEKRNYKKGEVIGSFKNELTKQTKKIIPYLNLIQKQNFYKCTVAKGDVRSIDKFLSDYVRKCDIAITSPPYATALPYIDSDRLSLIVMKLLSRKKHRELDLKMIGNREATSKELNIMEEEFAKSKDLLPNSIIRLIQKIGGFNKTHEVGFRKKNLPTLLKKYFLDMHRSMESVYLMMKNDAFVFYIVGNNSTYLEDERLIIPTDRFIWEIGKNVGFKQIQLINMDLLKSRDIFRKNQGTQESILVFKK